MEALVEEGLARQIGVPNCSAAKVVELLKNCRLRPAMNQVERHPWLQQKALLHRCQEEGIGITAYSPWAHPPAMARHHCSKIRHRSHRSCP